MTNRTIYVAESVHPICEYKIITRFRTPKGSVAKYPLFTTEQAVAIQTKLGLSSTVRYYNTLPAYTICPANRKLFNIVAK